MVNEDVFVIKILLYLLPQADHSVPPHYLFNDRVPSTDHE